VRVAAVLWAAALPAGCADEGRYEVHWTIGGAAAADPACPAAHESDLDLLEACSTNGLDIVVVYVLRGEAGICAGEVVEEVERACRAACTAGPIETGTLNVCAEALSPARARLTGAVVASDVEISDGKTRVVTIDLPAVPRCANGLDDNPDGGNGRVDEDAECSGASDGGE
jgi:hypothetical protein